MTRAWPTRSASVWVTLCVAILLLLALLLAAMPTLAQSSPTSVSTLHPASSISRSRSSAAATQPAPLLFAGTAWIQRRSTSQRCPRSPCRSRSHSAPRSGRIPSRSVPEAPARRKALAPPSASMCGFRTCPWICVAGRYNSWRRCAPGRWRRAGPGRAGPGSAPAVPARSQSSGIL